MGPAGSALSPDDIEVVAPNFKRRLSGVTATIQRLVPLQARSLGIVALGPNLGARVPRIGYSTLLKLWQQPKKRPFRIWHARRNTEMLAGLILRDVLRQPLRIVFTSASQRHHTAYTRALISRVDAVISTSRATASYLKRPSTVVMHGIDTDLFRPAADPAEAWRATGLPGSIGIGCFGRIRHQKGTDVFVDAMIRLLPRFPQATAIVLGRTTPQHQEFEAELHRRIAEAGLADRILFPGEVDVDAIADWYRRLSLFIAPQRWEGFGLTPLEAMASGVPVVATTVGAFPELVVAGETGDLVPPGDVDAMVAAAEAILSDPVRRQEMAEAARRHIAARFTLEREAAAVTAVYENLWQTAAHAEAEPSQNNT
ncbi:MAG: glycosyltransferase family 4 protein [Ancalomicrobiaceae bacterium]|nr:glycosyltransferase family 4 protein [Ancalomicrobiaceae bacterium]